MGTRFGSRIHLENPPNISGSGGSCPPCPPTFIFSETEQRSDAGFFLSPMRLTDLRKQADRVVISNLRLNETRNILDAQRVPLVTLTAAETRRLADVGLFGPFTYRTRARSGTPDTDEWGDAWTDGLLANQGVNHGNADPLAIANLTSATETRGFVEFNFTRFTGLFGSGSAHTFNFRASTATNLASNSLTLNFGAQASRWFTESTITWSNQPATPTLFTKSVTVVGDAAYPTYSVTLSDAELNLLLGKWGLIVFTEPATSALGISVLSRENANVAIDGMNFVMKFQR